MKTYEINIPNVNGPLAVEMTAEQVLEFHDKLTIFLNDNYKELTADPEAVEQGEQERNQDHVNDNQI